MALVGTPYITAQNFRDYLTGMDLTGITDPQLEDYIRQASRIADNYAGITFDLAALTERHMWTDTRRLYPDNTPIPINAVKSFTIHIGSGQRADIRLSDLFVNSRLGYVEVVSLATAIPLTAELISLGLIEVVADITYKTGYGAFAAQAITLTNTIDADDTTFDVSTTAGLAVDDVIRFGDESMWVIAIVDGNTVTVIRDVATNGIHAAQHTAGAVLSKLTLAIPYEVQLAVAMIVGSIIAARQQSEEGATGVRSFVIGSYSVTYGSADDGRGLGGFPFVPTVAADILYGYKHISLR